MPIIKSSANGLEITVIIFDKREIEALVELMKNATFVENTRTKVSAEILEEFFYAFGLSYPPKFT